MSHSIPIEHRPAKLSTVTLLSLSALGIVFGDIGTSPLYTLRAVLLSSGGAPTPDVVLGSLSLIVWTLIIIASVKYVGVAMRIDNDGEGGILALLSLFGVKRNRRPFIVAVGLMGAALIYGDGAITPAISVLSALEGLDVITPTFGPYVLPVSVLVLVALFAFQPNGTARIGKAFGPIMALWFFTIGILGIFGVAHHPTVLKAIDPVYGLRYLLSHGLTGFTVLGAVFLCVTGAEALYADMGHFGSKPIRLAWSTLVFPTLVLNYAGQAALALDGAAVDENMFYKLCPVEYLLPLVILATLATIIASQAIITGAFSMTRQAIQLGWLPPLQIVQTSATGYGQIYVGVVNWLLMIVTVALAVGFKKSDNLASAYGIAVSATMFATSVLLFIAMRELWKWSRFQAGTVAGLFMVVDAVFFCANLSKFLEGGYVPVALAILVYGVMFTWHKGSEAVTARIQESVIPIGEFMNQVDHDQISRVPGTAVFFTLTEEEAPPVMVWHVRQNRSLHRELFILKVNTRSTPWVAQSERLRVTEIAPNVWRGTASYGFMERPHIPRLLGKARAHGCSIDFKDVTYYIGHATILPRKEDKTLPAGVETAFAFMQRNSLPLSDYFRLPPDNVVEIGRQITV